MGRYAGTPLLVQGQAAIAQLPKADQIGRGASIQGHHTVLTPVKKLCAEEVEVDCSQFFAPTALTDDPSPYTLTVDTIEIDKY